jgi:hypothetical protein
VPILSALRFPALRWLILRLLFIGNSLLLRIITTFDIAANFWHGPFFSCITIYKMEVLHGSGHSKRGSYVIETTQQGIEATRTEVTSVKFI